MSTGIPKECISSSSIPCPRLNSGPGQLIPIHALVKTFRDGTTNVLCDKKTAEGGCEADPGKACFLESDGDLIPPAAGEVVAGSSGYGPEVVRAEVVRMLNLRRGFQDIKRAFLDDVEREIFKEAMKIANGNVEKCSILLNMDRAHVRAYLRRFGIPIMNL